MSNTSIKLDNREIHGKTVTAFETVGNPLFRSPYVRDGCATDIDKHIAWLEATGWEMLPIDDPNSGECTYALKHPEKLPQCTYEYLFIQMAICNKFDPPTIGYVYLLTSPTFPGVWKVGQTLQTPERRCNQINRSQLEKGDWGVVYFLKTWHYAKIEYAVKTHFCGKLKYQTEYFEGDINEAINFIVEMEKTLPIWKCSRGCEFACKGTPKNGVILCDALRRMFYKDRLDLQESDTLSHFEPDDVPLSTATDFDCSRENTC